MTDTIGNGIDKTILNAEEYDLSGADILRITNNDTKLLPYEMLRTYDSLEQVLSEKGSVTILYETSKNYGHWVVILDKGNRNIEFYDPYGLAPDQELNYDNDYHLRLHGGELIPHLTMLIQSGGYKVEYNKEQLQKYLPDVNTCGRYCALRVRFKDISMNKFNDLLTKNKHYNPDFWVSALTILV